MGKPIEYNHRGERLELVKSGQTYRLWPFPHVSTKVEVVKVDEGAQSLTVRGNNGLEDMDLSWELWEKMRPEFISETDDNRWSGFRKFPNGEMLDVRGFDRDGNRREYW